jgi:hypothetical protein
MVDANTLPQKPMPGEFLGALAHSFIGGLLGTMAGREKVTGYDTSDTGKQTPITAPKTTGDQLRDIARSALLGLAAGANAPKQKSGLASALGGLGAGAEDAVARSKEQDLLQRKQSTEEFERSQQAMLNKAQNAHLMIETARQVQDLREKTLEDQSRVAASGKDRYDAAVFAGNAAPVTDLHMDEVQKYLQDHKEYINFKPVLTKVLPQEGAVPDPKTGEVPVDRYYSLVDSTKPVKLTPMMVNDLKAIHFPGAESLAVGTEVPANQFWGLHYQWIKAYNEAEADPKNVDVLTSTGANGQPQFVAFNKATKSQQILKDESGKPLTGKLPDKSGVDELFNKMDENGQRKYPNSTRGYLQATRDYHSAEEQGSIEGSSFRVGNARLPIGFQPVPNAFDQTEGDLRTTLTAKGVQLPENFSTLYAVGHFKADSAVFTKSLRKGVPQISEADAVNLIRNFVNPNYDQNTWTQVKELKTGFANLKPSAPGGQLVAFNTAATHLGDLYDAATALRNGPNSYKFINQIAQRYGIETNQPAPVVFDAIRAAVVREIGKTFEGGAVDQETARDIEAQIQKSQSTDVIQRVAKENAKLMLDKAGSLVDSYHAITKEFPENATNSSALAAFDRMGVDSSRIGGHAPSSQSGGPQSGQGGQPPAGASNPVFKSATDRTVIGHIVNGQYVPVQPEVK